MDHLLPVGDGTERDETELVLSDVEELIRDRVRDMSFADQTFCLMTRRTTSEPGGEYVSRAHFAQRLSAADAGEFAWEPRGRITVLAELRKLVLGDFARHVWIVSHVLLEREFGSRFCGLEHRDLLTLEAHQTRWVAEVGNRTPVATVQRIGSFAEEKERIGHEKGHRKKKQGMRLTE